MIRITKLSYDESLGWDIEYEADTEEEAKLFETYLEDLYGQGYEDGQQFGYEKARKKYQRDDDDWYGYRCPSY